MDRPGRRTPRRATTLQLVALLAAAVLLVLLVGVLNSALAVRRNFQALVVTAAPPIPAEAAIRGPVFSLPTLGPTTHVAPEAVTVLLLGTDRRPGENATPRSDAIMVARLEPTRGRVALLSLPRDLWVPIPGHGYNRLNSAYLWGEHSRQQSGLSLARATVSQLLGTPIDYVVATDFRGFAGLIDALGGVTVDVERPLEDRRFPTANRGYTTVRFGMGPQRMDGATALAYARIRHPDDDFARGQRQQAVLLAILARLRERGDLSNLVAAERASATLVGFVQTDMPPERLLAIAWALRDLEPTAIEQFALNESDVLFGVENDRYAQQPRPGVIAHYTRMLVEGTRP